MNRKLYILFLAFLIVCLSDMKVFSDNNVITVYSGKRIGEVNKKVFGNNFIGYDPMTYENWAKQYYGYSDYGAGIWDSKWDGASNKEVINLGKEAGISIVRFPGGCGTHHYNWKNAIGKRKHFLYGIDEFLQTVEEVGAKDVVITVSYFTGNEQDAVDLVEYLNREYREFGVESELSEVLGKKDWAKERAKNGNIEPYGVKYFEIGNEVYHGDHRNIKNVLPKEYAYRYLRYYEAMKASDSSIKIGVVLRTSDWNKEVLEIVKDKLDFAIIHIYPSPKADWNKLEGMDIKDIFNISLNSGILKTEVRIQEALRILREKSGKDVPLAITEYNAGFAYKYRHSLGAALINAELLRIFMKPKHNILMANLWNFVNEAWGMIANGYSGKYKNLSLPYYKRPSFYVFKFYNEYFGDILLSVNVQFKENNLENHEKYFQRFSDTLKGFVIGKDLLKNTGWKFVNVEGVEIKGDEVMEIRFRAPTRFNYYHASKSCRVEPNTWYKVSGYIKTENLEVDKNEAGFKLSVQDKRGWNLTKWSQGTSSVRGTMDWTYVEKAFKTLPDAEEIKIIARRTGKSPPLKGNVFVKDIKLFKFMHKNNIFSQLSVNASLSKDEENIYLMVVNKNLEDSIPMTIELKDFMPVQKGYAWILNGPSVDATNEEDHNNVKVNHREFEVKSSNFRYTFSPHSLTALKIERSQSNNN